MMICDKCGNDRVAVITGKTSDMCCVTLGERKISGYVPNDMGIGGNDYLKFKMCLNCGKIQGTFPLLQTVIELPECDEDDEY